MKVLLLISLLTLCSFGQTKPQVKLYVEQFEEGFNIYADNAEYCPMSIHMELDLKNLSHEAGNKPVFLLQPSKQRQALATLYLIKSGKKTAYSYNYTTIYGDSQVKKPEQPPVLDLPFQKGEEFEIYQGYNGQISHQNENALDFEMPIGTPITAIQDGVVIKVVDQFNKTCFSPACMKYNNYIQIYHPDGTFSEYAHIKQNGAEVEVGDQIKKGQLIAKSGNVGYSSGPHLHLVVYLPRLKERLTLQTKFKTGDGSISEILIKDQRYTRDY